MVEHRFKTELGKKQENLKFLFVGTFNPEIKINKAEYFYGRNSFWCILPHALNKFCLADKGKTEWMQFCFDNNIGLIDLIESLESADEEKDFEEEKYSDKKLETLSPNFITNQILKLIDENNKSLKGVFFTRKTIEGEIGKEWSKIEGHCKNLTPQIYTSTLLSPSLRKTNLKSAIKNWREEIQKSLSL